MLEQRAVADADLSSEEERPEDRITAIERELAALDAGREERLGRELAGLEEELAGARARVSALEQAAAESRGALEAAERAADDARSARREAERAAEAARARAAEVGAELAAVNQFVRGAGATPGGVSASAGGGPAPRPLAERLHVEPGYELALAAVLGPRLTAAVVNDSIEGERVLNAAGKNGGSVLLRAPIRGPGQDALGGAAVPASPSVPGGQLLAHLVRPEGDVGALAERLLVGVWVVESVGALPETFSGVAVTRSGRLFDARTGELAQAPAGGAERLLEELAQARRPGRPFEQAVRDEAEARAALEHLGAAVAEADAAREAAESALRTALREAADAEEIASRSEWLIARRREAPDDGPEAVRRAELLGDLRAERRLAERIEREREERARALAALQTGAERDLALAATPTARPRPSRQRATPSRRAATLSRWSWTPAPRLATRPPPP